ncbi:hypothetical protein AXF42_Ash006676 [Apostasia shenzhenica]|uniref:DDE Tnp4 domain-containing protein n=1 Tax=Apostasia shenzhenica TaxID=1088818 RepID=A0A2I0AIT3_9ASPA|nr:hypothetical protein AXF42_Ash006676 [Apostasia shenzhenica]
MDPAVLLMLSNLLHLQSQLDPAAAFLSSPPSSPSSLLPTSPLSLSASSTAIPLLLFALASILSFVSSTSTSLSSSLPSNLNRRRRRRSSSSSPSPPSIPPPRAHPSSSLILSLPSDRSIFSMEPSARDARFRSLYGLSYPVFASLLDQLDHLLSSLSLPLPHDQALAISLYRLSRGLSSRSLSRLLQPPLPASLISRVTNSLTRLLATRLYSDYVKLPSHHRLLQSTSFFRDLSSLPNVVGAIASSAVRLRDSTEPSLRSSHRPFPSILLQVVADNRKVFFDACVRAPGSSDPASHLRDSSLYRRLSHSDSLRDPSLQVRGQQIRPFLAGDSSFPLLPFLLTPFSFSLSSAASGASTAEQEVFDAALAKVRASSIEPAIALLKGRWKILRNLNVGLDHAAQTVVACIVLHNICQIAGEPEDDGKYLWRDPPESPQPARPVESERALYYTGETFRQALAEDLYERQQRLSGGTGSL